MGKNPKPIFVRKAVAEGQGRIVKFAGFICAITDKNSKKRGVCFKADTQDQNSGLVTVDAWLSDNGPKWGEILTKEKVGCFAVAIATETQSMKDGKVYVNYTLDSIDIAPSKKGNGQKTGYPQNTNQGYGGYQQNAPQQGGYGGYNPQASAPQQNGGYQNGYQSQAPSQGGYAGYQPQPQQNGYGGYKPQQNAPQQGGYQQNTPAPQRQQNAPAQQGGSNGYNPQASAPQQNAPQQGNNGYGGYQPPQNAPQGQQGGYGGYQPPQNAPQQGSGNNGYGGYGGYGGYNPQG